MKFDKAVYNQFHTKHFPPLNNNSFVLCSQSSLRDLWPVPQLEKKKFNQKIFSRSTVSRSIFKGTFNSFHSEQLHKLGYILQEFYVTNQYREVAKTLQMLRRFKK